MPAKITKHEYNVKPCPACKAQGKNVWHRRPIPNNSKKVVNAQVPRDVKRIVDAVMSLLWIFVKSITFSLLFIAFTGNTPIVGAIFTVFLIWSLSAKVFSGRWRRIVQIIITQRDKNRD